MPSTNCGVIFTGSAPRSGSEPAVSAAKTEHLGDPVTVVEFKKERADDVVEPRTQTAARHDARPRLLRIEKQLRPRPRQLERDARFRTDFDPLGDADIVANRVAERGSEARVAEGVYVHRKRTIASTCAERNAQEGGERIDGGVGDGGGIGAGDVRGEGERGRIGHAGRQADH